MGKLCSTMILCYIIIMTDGLRRFTTAVEVVVVVVVVVRHRSNKITIQRTDMNYYYE